MRIDPVNIPAIRRVALYHSGSESMLSVTFDESELFAAHIFALRYERCHAFGFVLGDQEQEKWATEIGSFLRSLEISEDDMPALWNAQFNGDEEDPITYTVEDLIHDFEHYDAYERNSFTRIARTARVDYVMDQFSEWLKERSCA